MLKIGFSYDDALDFCVFYEMKLFDHCTSSDAKISMLKLSKANFGIDTEYNLWVSGKNGDACTTAENSGSGGSWIVNANQDCFQEFWFYCEYNNITSM